MKCAICGLEIGWESDVKRDWIPHFFEGDEGHGPVCTDCCESLLQTGEDGEMEVRPQYRGKIIYQDETYEDEEESDDYLSMGMIFN